MNLTGQPSQYKKNIVKFSQRLRSLELAATPLSCLVWSTILITLLVITTKLSAENETPKPTTNQPIDLGLTQEEKAWLQQHPVIRVGASSDFKPKLIKAEDGSLSGILPDYYALLGKRLGVRFEIVDKKWADILRLPIKAQHLDMLGMINRKLAKKRGLLTLDSPYGALVTAFARKDRPFQVTQDNDLAGLRVAYDKDLVFLAKYFEKHKDQIDSVGVESPLEAMKLVLQNKADVMVGFNHDSYLLLKNLIFDIEPVYVFQNLKAQSVLAVRADEPLLPGILEKAIDSISHAEWNRILAKWSWLPNSSETRKTINLSAQEKQFLKQHPRIRFGIDASWYPFVIPQAKGPAKGLDVDLLDKINALTGANIELVAGNWSELVEQAKNRQIDGLAESSTVPSRKKYFNFTDSYLSHFSALATTPERAHEFQSLGSLSDKKIAVHKGNAWVKNLLKSHHVTQLVEADDELTAFRLVFEEKADAALVNISTYSRLRTTYGNTFKIAHLLKNDPLDVVYSVRKDWPELRSIINKALAAIDQKAKDRLYEKWAGFSFVKPTSPISLSNEEQRWLAKNHTVRVSVSDYPPFMSIGKEGPMGISIDYLKLIQERTHVKFEFIQDMRPCKEKLRGVINHQGPDLLPCMKISSNGKSKQFFRNKYFSSPRVIYTSNNSKHIHGIDDLSGKTIAVPRESFINKQLEKQFPIIKRQLYDTEKQAMEAVMLGKADAYIGSLMLSSYLILENDFNNLKVAALSPFEDHDYSYGSRKDWPELSSIIKKGLETITPAEKVNIRSKYISIRYEHVHNSAIAKWVLMFAATAGGFLLLFFFWNRSLKKQVKEKTVKLELTNNSLLSEIHERKQTGKKLARSEEKYRNLVDTSLVGIFNSNVSGELLYVNDGLAKMFGFETPEAMRVEGTLPRWANLKQRDYMIEKLREHGAVNSIETTAVTQSGQHIQVLFSATLHKGVISAMVMDITDRKKAEVALLKSEQKYRATFEQSAVGIAHISPEGQFLRINQKFCDIIGYTQKEAQHFTFRDITYPEDLNADLENMRQLTEGKCETVHREKRYIRKNGLFVWVHLTASLLRDEKARPLFFVAVVEDISDRKQTETALMESEQRFRGTFEQTAMGIAHVSPEGNILRINQKFCNIVGYTPDEMQIMTLLDITPADDIKFTQNNLRLLMTGEADSIDRERQIICKNGDLIWVHLTVALLRDAEAQPLFFIGTIEDISVRKRMEEELRESNERFQRGFETANIAINLTSLDGRFIQTNDQMSQMYGYTKQELSMMTVSDLTHPEDMEESSKLIKKIKSGALDKFRIIKRYRHKDGHTVWGEVSTSLIKDSKGTPLYFIAYIMDITQHKLAENALRDSEARFRMIYENASIMINAADANGRMILWNKECEKVFGWSAEEVKAHPNPLELFYPDPDDRQQVIESISEISDNFSREWHPKRKDGSEVICLWANFKMNNGSTMSLGYDITEKKLAENALRNSEARFRMVFDNAPVLIEAFNMEGRWTLWNKECEKVFGWTEEEIFSHENPIELFYPDPEEQRQIFETILSTPDNVFREWYPRRKDGSIVACSWANYKLKDGNIISIGYDITEQQKTQKILQDYQQRLKSLAVQLTLAEEQERRRIAADLHDNVGQSLALTRLQLAAARKGLPKNNQQDTHFDEMSKSLLKAIQDTRHLIFELSSPSLNELGLGVAIDEWMQEQIAGKHDIKVELFDHTKALTLGNDIRAILFRNVRELLINVIKHAKATIVSVWLEQDSDQLSITVQDNGIGFDSSLAKPQSNSSQGYGLFSVQERMSDLGGSLEITSKPGAGSKFVLYLPMASAK